MPTLLIEFPAGRYHATPTGQHVNEGQIEWPPSPWRLLRALLAAGYNTLDWGGDLGQPTANRPPPLAQALLLKLAAVLPVYTLPDVIGAHSRHYMPLSILDKGRERTTLVFDTWARVDTDTLAVHWDCPLTPDEHALLGKLVARLGYLGRSESWTSCRLADPDQPTPEANCLPSTDGANPGPGWEQVPLLAALPPGDYDQWRAQAVAQALHGLALPEGGKRPPKALLDKREKAVAPYPPDLISCLQADTTWLRSFGWSQPPGSQRVFYRRPSASLAPGAPGPRPARQVAAPVQCMLLAMATDSGNDHALPAVTRTLPQAELLHRHLGGRIKYLAGHSRVLSGCDEQGRPLAGPHQHAHILHLDLDGDGHLEHILIWAPMQLDQDAQQAIRGLRQTVTKGGVGRLKLAMVAAGALTDLHRLPDPWGARLREVVPVGGAREWQSLTPFVPPRFPKPRGKNSREGQIQAELASRGLPPAAAIEFTGPLTTDAPLLRLRDADETAQGRPLPPRSVADARQRHYVRVRRNGPPPPEDRGLTLRLRFDEPIPGPLCLGYASHFGLGLFQAISA